MAKIINYVTPLDEENLNGGFYIVFVSENELVDGFMAHWGEEISIIDTILTKDGYNFEGWKYIDNENPVNSGSTFIVTQDTVFTAQFNLVCVHTYVNGVCTKCSHACIHNFVNGVCTICNISIGCNHTYLNGICTKCGYQCSNHTYSNGICTTCGYEHSPHSYNNSYSQYSASQHIAYCICGVSRFESHNFEDHSCSHGDIIRRCKDCDYTETINICSFTSSYEFISPSQHRAYCVCGNSQLESHTFNTSGKCTKCGYQCNNHNYSNGICTICGYEHSPHSYNYSYSQYSSSQHRAYCSCGVSRLESHNNIDQLSLNGDIIRRCMDCGYTVTIVHICLYTNSYSQYSASQHRAYCGCGASILQAHTFNSANTCTKCGYQCNNHNYSNGICTICGYEHSPHSYNYSYSQYSSSQHRAYCVCGVSRLESHNTIDQLSINGDIIRRCMNCGYTVTIVHTCSYTNSYSQYSASQHMAYCGCGASKLESHTFNSTNTCTKCGYHAHSYTNSYSPNNSSTHSAYCVCGASITEEHTFNSSNICTKCGYQVHIHLYNYKYKQSSSAKHEAYCACGDYILESHTALPCSKCGYPYGVIYDNVPSNDEQS